MAQFLHGVRPPPHLRSARCLFSPLEYVEALIWEHNRCLVPRNVPQNYTKPSATSSACKLLRWRLALISQTHIWQVAFAEMDLKIESLYFHHCFHCHEQYDNGLQGYSVFCELKMFVSLFLISVTFSSHQTECFPLECRIFLFRTIDHVNVEQTISIYKNIKHSRNV